MKQINNKAQKGFTLVEVIVVAVIVAILAAVAIPIYQSYVTDSRANSAKNAGGAVASFLGACVAGNGTASGTASEGNNGEASAVLECSGNSTTSILPQDINIVITATTVAANHVKLADSVFTFTYATAAP